MRQVRPGQVWMWAFNMNGGWWSALVVNEATRNHTGAADGWRHITFGRGEFFTVVSVNDKGPFEPGTFYKSNGEIYSGDDKRRHVVLLKSMLVWFGESWFEAAELVRDVL